MRKSIILTGLLLTALAAQPQLKAKKDSLLHLLPTVKDDSGKTMLLLKISSLYATSDFDSALLYLNKAKEFADEKGLTNCDPAINTAFSQYYYYNNDYKKSNEYALKNLALAEKNNDEKLLAKTYNNLAAICNHFGNYKSAIDYAFKCLELSEKTKDSASFPVRNLTASNTYYNLEQYDKAIFYSKRAIDFGKQFDNSFAVMMGLNNMASAYTNLHKVDTAITIYLQQLELAQQEEDIVNTSYALINLSKNYFLNNNLAGVDKYTTLLNAIAPKIPDKKTIAEIYAVNALRYTLRKEYVLARSTLDSGISIAIRENAIDALSNLYQAYSKFYFTQNKIKEAEDYAYKFDSLQSAANLKELNFYIENLSVQYETQKKEDQLKLQRAEIRQKSNLIYFLLTGAAAVVVISLLTYRNHKNKQKLQQAKIDELETEKQLTATEAVLKGEEQERSRLAKDLHDGLGGMLSGIKFSLSNMKQNLVMTPDHAQSFERSMDMLDSSIKEMRRVAHSMMPEVLMKYGLDTAVKEYCNEISRSGVLQIDYQSVGMAGVEPEQTISVTVYRIIQELVNNAIKHAGATHVLVQLHFSPAERQLTITVEDDGKGFDPVLLEQAPGIGWSNIQNRVEFLKGKLDVNSAIDHGTSVLIEITIS